MSTRNLVVAAIAAAAVAAASAAPLTERVAAASNATRHHYHHAAPTGKWFDRVLIIMFENHAEDEVLKDPNFHKYTNLGRGLENYFAATHPSQPNYIAMTSGDWKYCGNSDKNVDLDESNIADLLEAKGLDWRAYMEDYPGRCNPSASVGKYYRKHNPFISYNNIRNNPKRCAKITDTAALDADLKAGTLPAFMYLSPNIDNDAHNTNITFGGKWLDAFFSERLLKFPKGTLIVVTWDEDDYTEKNQVLTFLLDPNGNIFKAGTVDKTLYNHYSLLKTVEDNWDLGDLGRNDKTAVPFNFQA